MAVIQFDKVRIRAVDRDADQFNVIVQYHFTDTPDITVFNEQGPFHSDSVTPLEDLPGWPDGATFT
jgi:hypothetical protein